MHSLYLKKMRKHKTHISVSVRQYLISTTYLSLKNELYLNCCLPSQLLIHFLILYCKRYGLKKASKVNVIDQRTCPLLLGDFCHYDFLILQYIWHRMRYVSSQRKVTLFCNIKLIYVTQNKFNNILVPKLRYP